MKTRAVEFHEDATNSPHALYDWLSKAATPKTALGYLERIESYCQGIDITSERGQLREGIRPGLRVVGFERRVTIAFVVEEERVLILGIFYGGQNWESDFQP